MTLSCIDRPRFLQAGAAAAAVSATGAFAQTWPARPIRIVIPRRFFPQSLRGELMKREQDLIRYLLEVASAHGLESLPGMEGDDVASGTMPKIQDASYRSTFLPCSLSS